MIERKFVAQNMKEFNIQEYIQQNMKRIGMSHIKMQKTPLGEKIIIHTSRPGLVVGRKGDNIQKLTKMLKKEFKLENPQIEISEVEKPNLDANIVAERIASGIERFGTQKFKGIGHKTMTDAMNDGALGVEILISGKIPSSRARNWRFYQGYLKKCGNLAIEGVRKAYTTAEIKTGTVGIQVRIMPPDIKLPDNIQIMEEKEETRKEQSSFVSQKQDVSEKIEEIKKKGSAKGEVDESSADAEVPKEVEEESISDKEDVEVEEKDEE